MSWKCFFGHKWKRSKGQAGQLVQLSGGFQDIDTGGMKVNGRLYVEKCERCDEVRVYFSNGMVKEYLEDPYYFIDKYNIDLENL